MDKSFIRPGTLLRWYALKQLLYQEIESDSTILDIGSFDGFTSANIQKNIPRLNITVIDLDPSGLKLAKEKGLNTILSSAETLPIANSKIDTVLCLDLIEHVDNENAVIQEISRVLKKNGKLILTTPMENGVNFPLLGRQKSEKINLSWGHVRPGYSLDQLKALFESYDIIIEKSSAYFNIFTRLAHPLAAYKNILSSIYKFTLHTEPMIKLGCQEHIIIGRKV